MCISCRHYDCFLTRWKTFFVQCSYAASALLKIARPGRNERGSDAAADFNKGVTAR